MSAWDFTDAANPQPTVWPVCATCRAAFVYRRLMRATGPSGFFWTRDCKHKTADIGLMTGAGYKPLETEGAVA